MLPCAQGVQRVSTDFRLPSCFLLICGSRDVTLWWSFCCARMAAGIRSFARFDRKCRPPEQLQAERSALAWLSCSRARSRRYASVGACKCGHERDSAQHSRKHTSIARSGFNLLVKQAACEDLSSRFFTPVWRCLDYASQSSWNDCDC